MMTAVPEKYALEVGSPTPITSERQHGQYLSVLDKLASKDNRKCSLLAVSKPQDGRSQGHFEGRAIRVFVASDCVYVSRCLASKASSSFPSGVSLFRVFSIRGFDL
jgi:hypothetical protein